MVLLNKFVVVPLRPFFSKVTSMTPMGISSEALHGIWIIFVINIVLLGDKADSFMFLKDKTQLNRFGRMQEPKSYTLNKMSNNSEVIADEFKFTQPPSRSKIQDRQNDLEAVSEKPMKSPHDFNQVRKKRSFDGNYSPVCTPLIQRTRLLVALSGRDSTLVLVEQTPNLAQWFTTVTCSPEPCQGIDTTRYRSKCEKEMRHVPAIVRRGDSRTRSGWSNELYHDDILLSVACVCSIAEVGRS